MTVSQDSSDIKISELDGENIEEIAKICNIEPFSQPVAGYEKLTLVAKDGDKTVGFCVSLLVLDEVDVVAVGVLPEYRQKGIGKALIKEMVDKNFKKGAAAFFLEVRESNTAAFKLYLHTGFCPDGVIKNYYKNPTENAIRMILD